MVIKLYISGISGNKEVKKKQQRVQMILDSKQITYEAIDITEPGKEKDKEFMQQNGKVRESLGKHPLPPQIFNDDDFCGDYEDFDLANEVDELEKFLHIATITKDLENESKLNMKSCDSGEESDGFCNSSKTSNYDPYDYHTFKVTWNNVNGLQEQIIDTNNPAGENEQPEEVAKSEVNGDSEAVHVSESFTDNVIDKPETLTEDVPTPVEEEAMSGGEKDTVHENPESQEENNEKVAENEESEDKEEEVKEEEKEEEEVEVENPKEESEVEKPSEEESPHLMEETDLGENVDNENVEKNSENEDDDSE